MRIAVDFGRMAILCGLTSKRTIHCHTREASLRMGWSLIRTISNMKLSSGYIVEVTD